MDLLYEYMVIKLPWNNFKYENFVEQDECNFTLFFQILESC